MRAQAAQLAVFWAKLMPPFRNAVRLVDGKKGYRHTAQPEESVLPGQPFRRQIEQPVLASAGPCHDARLFSLIERTVEDGRRNSHLRQLRGLVLHECDQRGDDDRGFSQHQCRQLVTERLSAAGGHDNAGVVSCEQAAYDALLERAELGVSPIML